ncbi:MAG: allantoinase AllB [Candidatus Cloacimonetes bacterium]|nr:allantoinase AllB [Candidatus Cloacimonadota bacterium]
MIIKNGLVAFPGKSEFVKSTLEIRDGKISAILDNAPEGAECLDAEGLYVFPGAVDAHVHFDTPGFEEREDFYHGSSFAASGGVTTVIDMPCTSLPPVTNLAHLKHKLAAVKKQSVIDYAFYGGVSANNFATFEIDMEELAPYVAGYKTYLISGMESFGALNYEQLEKVLLVSKRLGLPVLLHAEDGKFIEKAEKRERQTGNKPLNYYRSRPEAAEMEAIYRAKGILAKTDGDLHIVHISSGEAAEIAFKAGISVETCPHYLAFSFSDFQKQGSILKVAPCIKQAPAHEELWKQLANGNISFVASDHAPCRLEDKATGSIWSDYSGIAGTGTLFPYLLSEGYFQKRLGLARFLEITSSKAAERYGLAKRKGSIEVGKDADLVLVNPRKHWKVKAEEFLSQGKISPWEDETFRGKVVMTILRGKVIYEENKGILAKAGSGDFLGN